MVDEKGKDPSLPKPSKLLTKILVVEQLLDWNQIDTVCTTDNAYELQHGKVFTKKEMEVLWKDIELLVKPF
ncbi:hypothetical protein H2248_008807 [Termitomyces sp. 'cryptogamus']|nr:hypothetical protein H2248_008807 [Termitomyces sp. 'cryptogamus']